jgi:hypothetical protein
LAVGFWTAYRPRLRAAAAQACAIRAGRAVRIILWTAGRYLSFLDHIVAHQLADMCRASVVRSHDDDDDVSDSD